MVGKSWNNIDSKIEEAIMDQVVLLKERLSKIEADLEEARRRLPAHSVKPVQMATVFDLEDERDAILKEISRCKAEIETPRP